MSDVKSTNVPEVHEWRARLFSRDTQALLYNFKKNPVQRMLDFDYLCRKDKPSLAGLIHAGGFRGNHKAFYGTKEVLLHVYGTIREAAEAQPNADVFINYASFRSAAAASLEALKCPTIHTVVIIAEGIPERLSKKILSLARRLNKVVIGPATVGGLQAGAFKIADAAGTIDNIRETKLYRPGSVGFVSKSGGLSNEMYNILSQTTNGLYEGIAIGGDVYPGSTFADHVWRYQNIDEIKMIVLLGELGGDNEYGVVEMMKSGKITKPVLAWVSGTCAAMFPTEVQFGHAGARSGGQERESAKSKNDALREAGALVPRSFEDFAELIQRTYRSLLSDGTITPTDTAVSGSESGAPVFPMDFTEAERQGRVRRATGVVTSICDDRGSEPTYAGVPIPTLIERGVTVGHVVGLLWFKQELPNFAARFIELILMLAADHGPCVSGAHNTIVAARAGKDLVSCVASGLLTIGPRFGGAIDDAARCFKDAVDTGLSPMEYVTKMKKAGINVPGIGHRIKSASNRDQRVDLLIAYARENFSSTRYLDFALEVEKITLTKSINLILNVDGCIGSLFVDLMNSCAGFSKDEIDSIIDNGTLNGLFVLARTIGLIGHTLDQKRYKQPLYRHPWDDVLYL